MILDVGRDTGGASVWLRERYPTVHIIGLDSNPTFAELCRNADDARIVDLNEGLPDLEAAGLVLCLDVLEYLVEPDRMRR